MDVQNLSYALIQVLHNFGAAAVVGGAVFGRWPRQPSSDIRRTLAWLILIGWAIQGVSGAGFGAISYLFYGQFPDISGVAVIALLIKMVCAASGFILAAAYLRYARIWNAGRQEWLWDGLLLLAVVALTAAAFLRWYS